MTPVSWRRASAQLSEFIENAAAVTAGLVGFTWHGCVDAPSTYPDLREAFEQSLVTGSPLPISNENTDSVIYTDPSLNMALRFWHDSWHVVRGLDFTAGPELRLAQLHLGALEAAGFERGSLPWRMLQADLIGQVYLSAVGRRFPVDQSAFVKRALLHGIDAAVLMEIGEEASEDRPALLTPVTVA